jgi:hypothetical protein
MTLTNAPEAPATEPVEQAEAAKACTGPCGRVLPLPSFGVNRARKDGRRSECRDCARQRRGPRGREGRLALGLARELEGLLGIYSAPALSDVLTRAVEEVRQIGAVGERRDEQVEAVRHAVLVQGCRRVEEVIEETRLSRWVVAHALKLLVRQRVLEERDAFRLGEEAEAAGRPVVEYHPRAYPRGEGFSRLFRRLDSGEELEVEP